MLHDFFRKHENRDFMNDHIDSFHKQFSDNQKKAILCSLFFIAQSDDEFHSNEQEFLKQISTLLNYPLSIELFIEFLRMEPYEIVEYLDELNDLQKDWYIVTAFMMVHADGKALDSEYIDLKYYLDSMNITAERFERAIKKSLAILNKYQ